MEINQYDIFWVNLDPTMGSEINKTRPCVVISPNEMNQNIRTVIIAPLTTASKPYPTRIEVKIKRKKSWIVIDQIRTVDKGRLYNQIGKLDFKTAIKIKEVIKETFVD